MVGRKSDGNSGGKSGGGASPVLTMVQHLCVSAPERAEGRARLAEGLATLLPELEGSDRARFVSFLAKVRFFFRVMLGWGWSWWVKCRYWFVTFHQRLPRCGSCGFALFVVVFVNHV